MKLTIIIPAFNEENTILDILKKIKKAKVGKIKKEIIIVDDFSTDNTRKILSSIKDKRIRVFYQSKNYGKGFAIRTALKQSRGDVIIIQDADMEYDPQDYKKLLGPILHHGAKVVYGSRFIKNNKTNGIKSFYFGNKILSFFTSILYFQKITDMETCYKAFRKDILENINLKCKRFEFEPEITAKTIKKGIKIREVSIRYYPRDKNEGKKIKWRDGVVAIWTLIKYRFVD